MKKIIIAPRPSPSAAHGSKLTQPGERTWRRGFHLIALASLALAPATRAVSPPPDGGYPGYNTAEGEGALSVLTTGLSNTAIGYVALVKNTTGSNNTAVGFQSGYYNTTGDANTAVGQDALLLNTTGGYNTASGAAALFSNTGSYNTATGFSTLLSNTTGVYNTANGAQALYSNTTGNSNTANGVNALLYNTIGGSNTANGYLALSASTTGSDNTASGASALSTNTTGNNNTANGQQALSLNVSGSNNTAEGFKALSNNKGASNIALGESAGINLTTGSNNIDLGNKGVAGESDTIRLGKKGTQTATFIAGISGTTVAGGVGVIVDTNGRLGTVTSSARFKDAIQPMNDASEAILALQPVTFHYRHELDPAGVPQFGLVAEQVEKVNPDLVARDEQGKPYTVRYEAVNAMLLNEFLKEHRKVEEQEAAISEVKTIVMQLRATIAKEAAPIAQQQECVETVTADLKNRDRKYKRSGHRSLRSGLRRNWPSTINKAD